MVTISHFILCRQPFCQLCEKVILRWSKHVDVIIETQTATYLSFGYFEKHMATLGGANVVVVVWGWRAALFDSPRGGTSPCRGLRMWTKGLQEVVRWFPDADHNPDSNHNLIISFWAFYYVS